MTDQVTTAVGYCTKVDRLSLERPDHVLIRAYLPMAEVRNVIVVRDDIYVMTSRVDIGSRSVLDEVLLTQQNDKFDSNALDRIRHGLGRYIITGPEPISRPQTETVISKDLLRYLTFLPSLHRVAYKERCKGDYEPILDTTVLPLESLCVDELIDRRVSDFGVGDIEELRSDRDRGCGGSPSARQDGVGLASSSASAG